MKTSKQRETWAERKFRLLLDKKGIGYKQHYRILGMEVDFSFVENIVVEVDGYVHLKPEVVQKDQRKNKLLRNRGYKVIRFTNLDILYDVRGCLKILEQARSTYYVSRRCG